MKSPGRVWRDQKRSGRVERESERERLWKQRGVWGVGGNWGDGMDNCGGQVGGNWGDGRCGCQMGGEMAGTIVFFLSGCEGATRVIA